jgi:hypothetical protein
MQHKIRIFQYEMQEFLKCNRRMRVSHSKARPKKSRYRGQMTVLMRQAGLKVPVIYGPAREEWQEFGMAAPV